jgi:hypothetical protein
MVFDELRREAAALTDRLAQLEPRSRARGAVASAARGRQLSRAGLGLGNQKGLR